MRRWISGWVDRRLARPLDGRVHHGDRDGQIYPVHHAITRHERRHDQIDVHRDAHANDVVLEERTPEGIERRRVLVREIELDVVHADAAQPLEMHRREVRAQKEAALAEGLRALAKDRPARRGGFDRQPAHELVCDAARGCADRCVRHAGRQGVAEQVEDVARGALGRRNEVRAVAGERAGEAQGLAAVTKGEEIGADLLPQRLCRERRNGDEQKRSESVATHEGSRVKCAPMIAVALLDVHLRPAWQFPLRTFIRRMSCVSSPSS